jgi:Electron transfer flavoprotein domain
LFALSEARRIAHAAGLTVFALALDEPNASTRAESFASTLGRAGADRVLFCEAPGLGAPPLDVTHGRALFTAAERVPPIVVLFPTGGPGEELGPALAMRLGAAYAPGVDIVLSDEAGPLADGVGRITLRRWRADRSGYRQLDPVEIERPVVAILGAHGAPREDGTSDVDIEVIACPPSADGAAVSELGSEPDELDVVAQARGLVILAPDLAPAIGARLRAAAPAGLAVIDGGVAPRALVAISPELVIEVGGGELDVEVGVSPRASIGLVKISSDGSESAEGATPAATNAARLHPDLVWTVAPGSDPWDELIAAWGALR